MDNNPNSQQTPLLIKISTNKYPYTLQELQADYPYTTFHPKLHELEDADLAEFDVAFVVQAQPPENFDPTTQQLVPAAQPEFEEAAGKWVLGWQIKPAAPSPPNWTAFNAAMTTNAAKVAYDLALVPINPTLAGKLDLAYLMITTHGLENFAQLWPVYCQLANVSTAHRAEWAELAEHANLPASFVDLIRGGPADLEPQPE